MKAVVRRSLVLMFVVTLLFVFVPMVAVGGAVIGKKVEDAFFPVVSEFSFELVNDEQKGAMFQVFGKKDRPCTFLAVSTLVETRPGIWVAGNVQFFRERDVPRTDLITRPTGTQDFGYWRVYPKGSRYRFLTRHQCHLLWETQTDLGVIEASQDD